VTSGAPLRTLRHVAAVVHGFRRLSRDSGFAAPAWKNQAVEECAVVIHQEAEGGFWAEVPALPGCYSQGETIDELMANVREAITGVLEVMRERVRGQRRKFRSWT
jgi:predicted RNase H-like HicB family nuclease